MSLVNQYLLKPVKAFDHVSKRNVGLVHAYRTIDGLVFTAEILDGAGLWTQVSIADISTSDLQGLYGLMKQCGLVEGGTL